MCYTGSDEKLAVCRQYGADVGINYKTQDFPTEVLAATNNKGIVQHRPTCIHIPSYCMVMVAHLKSSKDTCFDLIWCAIMIQVLM